MASSDSPSSLVDLEDGKNRLLTLLSPQELDSPLMKQFLEQYATIAMCVSDLAKSELSMYNLMKKATLIMEYDIILYKKPYTKLPENYLLQTALLCVVLASKHYNKLQLRNLDDLKSRYPSISFPKMGEADVTLLLEFVCVVNVLVELMPGRNNRRRILQLATCISEGRNAKRVMGGGAKPLTRVRDQIICLEGEVEVVPRPNRLHALSDDSTHTDSEWSKPKKRKLKNIYRDEVAVSPISHGDADISETASQYSFSGHRDHTSPLTPIHSDFPQPGTYHIYRNEVAVSPISHDDADISETGSHRDHTSPLTPIHSDFPQPGTYEDDYLNAYITLDVSPVHMDDNLYIETLLEGL